jgi:hypothetical protein
MKTSWALALVNLGGPITGRSVWVLGWRQYIPTPEGRCYLLGILPIFRLWPWPRRWR